MLTDLDKLLIEEKNRIEEMKAPDNMEETLREALSNAQEKKTKGRRIRVAAILILVFLLGYNIDTLANYGKKILGYESVMIDTLYNLNELGKGQIIGETYVFSDGVSATVDGAMLDDNNLILFFSIEDPNGEVRDVYHNMDIGLVGLGEGVGYGMEGDIFNNGQIFKWILRTNEAPKNYEDNLELNIRYSNDNKDVEIGEIKFKLDQTSLVGQSIRISIDKKVATDNGEVLFESLVASPTSTVIKAKWLDIVENKMFGISGEVYLRYFPNGMNMRLVADGEEVVIQGMGMNGEDIDFTFDAIPTDAKKVKLYLSSYYAEYEIDEKFELQKGISKDINVNGKAMNIDQVYEEEGSTFVVISSEAETVLPEVYLNIDGRRYPVKEIVTEEFELVRIGESFARFYTRTFRFEDVGDKLELDIQRIMHKVVVDKLIYTFKIK